MSQVIWKSIFALTIVSGILGCNKTPRQYSGSYKPLEVSNDLSNVPNRKAWENPDVLSNDTNSKLTQEQIVEQIRKNSSQPVVYKYGAGGINFSTEYIDSKNILAKPIQGPLDDGLTFYDENIVVYWKADEPRLPEAIIVLSGYLGPVDLGLTNDKNDPVNSYMREEFSKVLSNSELESSFIRKLYLKWEKVEDAKYDCLAQNSCLIDRESDKRYVKFQLPQGVLYFSNDDRKSLSMIVLINNSPLGVLNNDIEFLTGKISIPADFDLPGVSEEERPSDIGIGDNWSKFLKLLGEQTAYYVNTKSFGKIFSGITAYTTKSSYERDYREPKPNEEVLRLDLLLDFKKSILIGGKKWTVNLAEDNSVSLTEGCDENSINKESSECLSTLISILAQNTEAQKDFLKKLVIVILNEKMIKLGLSESSYQKDVLNNKVGVVSVKDYKFQWILSGFETLEGHNSYSATINSAKEGDDSAWSYYISISKEKSILQYSVIKTVDSLDLHYSKEVFKDVDLNTNSIGGFKLGDKVLVKDIDLGRSEATVIVKTEEGKDLASRVSYGEDQSVQVYTLHNEKIKLETFVLDFVAVGGVSLGLSKIEMLETDGSKVYLMEVNYIASGVKGKTLKGLCESKNVNIDFLLPLNEFPSVLQKIKSSMKSEGKSCLYEAPLDKNGSGLNLEYFFPKQKVVLSFDNSSDSGFDRELISVGIYKRPGEEVKGEE